MVRIGRTALVWIVVLFTAVDPASACRWRYRRQCCPPPCYYYCYTPCPPVDCCGTTTAPASATDTLPSPSDLPPAPRPVQPAPLPAPIAPTPTPRPAPPAPAPTFEEPAAEVPAPAEPAAPEMPEEPAAVETPAEDAPELPAEKPAKPSEDVEDLFKDSDTDNKKTDTEEPEKKSDDVEDLFKETDEKPKAATLEASPVSTISQELEKELEDLFSEPADASPVAAAPAPRQQESARVETQSQPTAGSESPSGMRTWTDNTGNYRVRARLVVVGQRHVRLLKDNGRYTTVPMERLSHDDLAFVRHHASSVIAGN